MGETYESKKFHIAMFPWFAMGHLTPFLDLANKLAQRGHKISFILPKKTSYKLASRNHYPEHISFVPIVVPAVDGLPIGAETTSDAPNFPLLMTAMDLTRPTIESLVSKLKPQVIFFDYTHWLPCMAHEHIVKAIHFSIVHANFLAYLSPIARSKSNENDLSHPPLGFPSSVIRLQTHEAKRLAAVSELVTLDGISLVERVWAGIQDSDALCFKGCREMEAPFGEYLEKHHGKPVLWAGPGLPEPPKVALDEKMDGWLKGFEKGSVVYCALGSEWVLEKEQFQELLLGLELTGLPFLAILKLPTGCETIDTAMPQGFAQRTKDRGLVHQGWVQQDLILQHPSIGCFVTHCGAASLSESLITDCQLVLLPMNGDQVTTSRLISVELKIAVEIKRRDEDGFFTKEDVNEAISKVLDPKCELGVEVRKNHARWKELLLKEGYEDSYIDGIVQSLQKLLE